MSYERGTHVAPSGSPQRLRTRQLTKLGNFCFRRDFHLTNGKWRAKARIWPGLSRLCRIHSTVGPPPCNHCDRGTSLIRNNPLLTPYSRTLPRAIWWPWGGGVFLMGEVPLYARSQVETRFRGLGVGGFRVQGRQTSAEVPGVPLGGTLSPRARPLHPKP